MHESTNPSTESTSTDPIDVPIESNWFDFTKEKLS